MKDTICSLAPNKRHIVRTLTDSCGMDLTVNYVRGLMECQPGHWRPVWSQRGETVLPGLNILVHSASRLQLVVEIRLVELGPPQAALSSIPDLRSPDLEVFINVLNEELGARI
jgi:hypothetical protein